MAGMIVDRAQIARALAEDIGRGDATTLACVSATAEASGRIITRRAGVIAGLPIAQRVFSQLDPAVEFRPAIGEGAVVRPGETVARIFGRAHPILTGERVALNFLGRLSGIATLTARCVSALEGTSTRILDTRKTTPGLRALEKEAVRLGGGQNHRFGLNDGVLIKDNHIKAAGGITQAINAARGQAPHLLKIEIECETLAEVEQAVQAGADVILLDNMSIEMMRSAVAFVRRADPRTLLEASGSIGTDTAKLAAVAATGVDFISLGALTHSAPNFDVSLEFA